MVLFPSDGFGLERTMIRGRSPFWPESKIEVRTERNDSPSSDGLCSQLASSVPRVAGMTPSSGKFRQTEASPGACILLSDRSRIMTNAMPANAPDSKPRDVLKLKSGLYGSEGGVARSTTRRLLARIAAAM